MKTNVMIFSSNGYNAVQIYFSLIHSMMFHPIMAGSCDSHASYISNEAIIDLPFIDEKDFIEKLNQCIDEHDIKFIIPTHDSIAVALMENQHEIHAVVTCPSLKTAQICRHKTLTYKALEGLDFIPATYTYENAEFPLFAKDDVGQGGRNTRIIRTQTELDNLKEDAIDYVLCEYLPGKEVTMDCFTDRHGILRFCQPRYRERILNGITARTSNAELTDELWNIAEEVSKKIQFRGYWYVQCKQNPEGKFKLMEVSTRFAGTFDLSKSLDVNLPLLTLCDYSNMDVDITPNKYKISLDKNYIDRYKIDYQYKRVYWDPDNTLVFQSGKYNTEAIRFLYQCLNKGIKMVLITNHAFNVHENLKNLRFNEDLFDEIIEVPLDHFKYEFMDNNISSIMIDNAYAERKLAKEHLGMSTFDVSNIDCLIDWADD